MKTHRDVIRLLVMLLVSASCSDYVPPESTLRLRAGTFVTPDATKIRPLYGNADVDCLYGRYELAAATAPDMTLAKIDVQATQAGWSVQRHGPRMREFRRVTPGRIPSYEIVRVVIPQGESPVYVAWLQLDGPLSPESAERSHEGQWAADNFWPRFEASVSNAQ